MNKICVLCKEKPGKPNVLVPKPICDDCLAETLDIFIRDKHPLHPDLSKQKKANMAEKK